GSKMKALSGARKGPSPRIPTWVSSSDAQTGRGLPLSGYPVRACQRYLGHRGSLNRERNQVVGFEMMNVGLAACPGQRGELHGQSLEVVGHPPRPDFGVETALKIWVLGSHADRT